MTWVGIIIAIIIIVVLASSRKTAKLNKDESQKAKLKEIVDAYNQYKSEKINDIELNSKITFAVMGAKNKLHLASMVKTHGSMNLPAEDADSLYQIVSELAVKLES